MSKWAVSDLVNEHTSVYSVQLEVYSTGELGLMEMDDRFGAPRASHCNLFLAAKLVQIIL